MVVDAGRIDDDVIQRFAGALLLQRDSFGDPMIQSRRRSFGQQRNQIARGDMGFVGEPGTARQALVIDCEPIFQS